MTHRLILILFAALMAAALSGCAGKRNRYYVGQCAIPGHWFCGKVYDKFSDCNNDRKRHDYETSLPGTCYSGSRDGDPDTRSM